MKGRGGAKNKGKGEKGRGKGKGQRIKGGGKVNLEFKTRRFERIG